MAGFVESWGVHISPTFTKEPGTSGKSSCPMLGKKPCWIVALLGPDPVGVQPRSEPRFAINTMYPFPLRIISYFSLPIETRSFQDKVGCHPNIDLRALINMTLPN